MKKKLFLVLFACLATNYVFGQLALDENNIKKAKSALDQTKNCNQAMGFLRLVSDTGKTTQDYLVTLARVYDCRADKEEAIKYYTKYLEKDPDNEIVKTRIVELRETKTSAREAANQEQKAKDLYKAAKKGTKRTHAVSGSDFTWGLSMNKFTGGSNTPYGQSFNLYNTFEYPMAKNKMLFDFTLAAGLLTGGREEWFAKVLYVAPGDVLKVPGSVQIALELALTGVVMNKEKYALSAGPLLGFSAAVMNGADVVNASNTYSNPFMVSPLTGLKSSLYLGEHFSASLAYLVCLRTSYNNELNNGTTVTGLKGNSIRLSVGIRGFGFPTAHYYHY